MPCNAISRLKSNTIEIICVHSTYLSIGITVGIVFFLFHSSLSLNNPGSIFSNQTLKNNSIYVAGKDALFSTEIPIKADILRKEKAYTFTLRVSRLEKVTRNDLNAIKARDAIRMKRGMSLLRSRISSELIMPFDRVYNGRPP